MTEKENKEVIFNLQMVEAYKRIVKRLSDYVAELPTVLAHNLSEKVRKYYILLTNMMQILK